MFFEEVGDDVCAEDVADAALAFAPALEVDFGVAPQQVAEDAFVKIEPVSGTSAGRLILSICWKLLRSGERPPCMQMILSSMMAMTGRVLKQSPKSFQSLMLYLIAGGTCACTRRRSRRAC